MPPLGIEARMSRLTEACKEWSITPTRLLSKAAEFPAGAFTGRIYPETPDVLVTRLEWAFEAISGHPVPKKSARRRKVARDRYRET